MESSRQQAYNRGCRNLSDYRCQQENVCGSGNNVRSSRNHNCNVRKEMPKQDCRCEMPKQECECEMPRMECGCMMPKHECGCEMSKNAMGRRMPHENCVNDCITYAPVDSMPLAMAYVPWQKFGCNVFDGQMGLQNGTIFPELVLPFCGTICERKYGRR